MEVRSLMAFGGEKEKIIAFFHNNFDLLNKICWSSTYLDDYAVFWIHLRDPSERAYKERYYLKREIISLLEENNISWRIIEIRDQITAVSFEAEINGEEDTTLHNLFYIQKVIKEDF